MSDAAVRSTWTCLIVGRLRGDGPVPLTETGAGTTGGWTPVLSTEDEQDRA